MSVKEQVLEAIGRLPDDATIGDMMERLYLLHKIQLGLDQADAGQQVPHEGARRRFAQWLE